MKKIFTKETLLFFIMFVALFSLAFYMNIYSRSLIDLQAFGFTELKYHLYWIGFSLSWILLMLLIVYFVPKKQRGTIFFIINFLWNILFFAQICYVQQLGKFMIFSDLFVAGEGLQYIKAIFSNINMGMLITNFISIASSIMVIILNHNITNKSDVKPNKIIVGVTIFLIIFFRGSAYLGLGSQSEANSWRENYNAKNIYVNFTNPNSAMFISGFYEYNTRAIYKYIYNLFTLDKTALRNSVDEYNRIYGTTHQDNEYTGLFKDKNVIYVMMESIDSWIVDETTMPTLYNMMQTGLNFKNRYSPFFNGGQTINTEFACNTGLYAISDKKTIYDIDDVDYKYSLASTLSRNGYRVNSFHANSANFYNRSNFHKLLGYNHHYSFMDMQKANILADNINYFSDSQAISDDKIFELIAGDEKFMSFITTYSAHLEYTKDNKVFKSIKHSLKDQYNDEEYVYRTLANDTDNFLKILIDKLTSSGKLDNTIIVLVSDHYVYGYSDPEYVSLKKNVLNDRKLLQNTPLVIWSNDMEGKTVDTIMDTADILPSLLNLLGISYNNNWYMGTDVFGEEHDRFVWFSDGTYIASNDCALSNEAILTKVNYNIAKNKSILLTNYYGI